MKSLIFKVLLCAITLTACTPKTHIDLSALPEHPRLLLQKGEEVQLLQDIAASEEWTTIHNNLLEECDRIIDLPVSERKKEGMRLLYVSQENLRRIFMLSYAYRTTLEQKYLDRAEAEMLAIASFKDWNPSHFLDVGEMTMAMAIGYDWLYDQLSEESRSTIEEAIIRLGLVASYEDVEDPWFYSSNHNWNQVCNGGLTFGALAVAEQAPELAQKVVERAVEGMFLPMECYGPDGAYAEGINYWEYGTQFNALFLSAIQGALGSDFGLKETPGFMKTGEYALHMVSPNLKMFNYMDNRERRVMSTSPFWLNKELGDPSLVYVQSKILVADTAKTYLKNRTLPAAIVWGASYSLKEPVVPTKCFYLADGETPICAMRSSWDDPDALYLGAKLGATATAHGHMDVGSFLFEGAGVRWAIELGPEYYNSVETLSIDLWDNTQNSQRWDIFRYNNYSHNVLIFNDKKQVVEARGEIGTYSDDPAHSFLTTDLSEVYGGQVESAERAFSLVGENYAVIEDQITSGEHYTRMRWNMITQAAVKQLSDNVVELTQEGKTCLIKVECEHPIRWHFEPTPTRNAFDTPNPDVTIVSFDCDLPLNAQSTFRVFLMPKGEVDTSNFTSKLSAK